MNKNIMIVGILCLVVLSAMLVLNVHEKESPTFDKCENAKSFTNSYNPEFYNEDSANFYNEIKKEIIMECIEE